MASIFSKIVAGEIPAYKVFEDEVCLAFLDVNPLVEGHVLVIPKKETDYIFDMAPEEYARLWSVAKKVAPAIEKVIACKRIGVAVVGLEVPHAHIHLVPLQDVADLNFKKERAKVSPERMQDIATQIANHPS